MLIELATLCVAALLTLSVAAVVLSARPRAPALLYGATILPCLLAAGIGLVQLAGGPAQTLVLPFGLPWLGAHLRLDALSAFFLLVIGLGAAATSLYAIGYGRDEPEPGRTLPFYPGFIGAMLLVVLADDAFTFLMSWEVMSLLSWALVLTRHREAQTRSAALLYLTMAAGGTMALLLAFGLLSDGGAYGFETIRATPHSALTATAILALMLVGAGSKAGLAPLHLWLPEAHPAAPSHVSALMSGVMTKVAVYGFLRVVFDLVGPLPWWASSVVIGIGAVTAVLGILNAVMADDMKRALAYSTIENIGVIFTAIGLALAFRANGMEAAAALAMSAALFHIFNHMAFKSLLFMGAGAVLHATGSRALDRLGGLIHRMPATSVLMLIGVTAIAALPPLNGFASEWLVFQSVLKSPDLPQPGLQIIVPAAGGMLALAAALAAAAFVRLYGLAFLGRPRSAEAEHAHEVDRFMLTAMGALAALCILAGVVPALVLDRLAPAAELLTAARLPVQGAQPWLTLVPIAEARSTYNPLLVFVFVTVTAWAAAWAVHRFGSHGLRRGPAWDCGFPNADPISQYGAGSFAQPLRRVLGAVVLRAREEVEMPPPGDGRPARHHVVTHDVIEEALYRPVVAAVWRIATAANRLQFLTIRRYLSLVMGALVGLLVVLTLWR